MVPTAGLEPAHIDTTERVFSMVFGHHGVQKRRPNVAPAFETGNEVAVRTLVHWKPDTS